MLFQYGCFKSSGCQKEDKWTDYEYKLIAV